MSNERKARWAITVILVLFVCLGVAYAIVTPTLEAPDEIHHYNYVRSLINTGRPPVLEEGGGRGFGHHAPFYYAVGAVSSFWAGEDDLEEWDQRYNPFFGYEFGEVGRDNKNLYLHPDDDSFGTSDTWLGIRVVRIVSVLMGALTIWFVYLIAREIFPERFELAVGAAGLAAFIPEFLFISGAVNDDNGAALFGSMALWGMMRILRRGPNLARCVGLGVSLGLGWLSKLTMVALVPTAGLVIMLAAWRERSWRDLFRWGLVLLAVTALFVAPWLVRQTVLYGDPTGTSREMTEWGLRDEPPSLADLGPDLYWLRTSFWGRLGYNQIPLSGWIYDLLDGISLIALLGLVRLVIRRRRRSSYVGLHTSILAARQYQLTVLIIALIATFAPMVVRRFLRPMPNFGRYLFPVLPSIVILVFLGLASWVPRRRQFLLAIVVSAAMLALGVAGLTYYLAPAFGLPAIYEPAEAPQPTYHLDWTYLEPSEDDAGLPLARLYGYDLRRESVRPGTKVWVTLYWEVLGDTDENYVLFAQLFGREEVRVGQRDTYPGLGHYPTSFWQPGQIIADEIPIPVAADAAAPSMVRLDVGLYDPDGGRLLVVDGAGDLVETPTVGQLRLAPAEEPARPQNATDYRLGDDIALIGYGIERENGDLTLSIEWACLGVIERDYTVLVHLLDDTGALVSQADGPPVGGYYPTSYWIPGDIIPETRVITVTELEPGNYRILVGMYLLDTGERLPVADAAGSLLPDGVIPLIEVSIP